MAQGIVPIKSEIDNPASGNARAQIVDVEAANGEVILSPCWLQALRVLIL